MSESPTTPWRQIDDPDALTDALIGLYEAKGNGRYDEAVTQTEHAVQSADLAAAAAADDSLVVAALLHDIGHLLLDEHDRRGDFLDRDLHHEEIAARFLSTWFGPDVTEPIRHHVAAKRYLCAIEPSYHDTLSAASARSLEVQGGPMTSAAAAEFAGMHGADAAAEVRRWDDGAKNPERQARPIRDFAPLIRSLVRMP